MRRTYIVDLQSSSDGTSRRSSIIPGPSMHTAPDSIDYYQVPFIGTSANSANSRYIETANGVVIPARDLGQTTIIAGYYNPYSAPHAPINRPNFDLLLLSTTSSEGYCPQLMTPSQSSLVSVPYRLQHQSSQRRQHTFIEPSGHTYHVTYYYPQPGSPGSLQGLISVSPASGPRPTEFASTHYMNTVIPLHYQAQHRVVRIERSSRFGVVLDSRVPMRSQAGYRVDSEPASAPASPTLEIDGYQNSQTQEIRESDE